MERPNATLSASDCGLRQRADRVRHRPAQLVKARVGKVDLTFDTAGTDDLEPRSRGYELVEQR